MRIVFWTASHLPDLGGLQWSTFRLAKALKALGHEVLFLTATTGGSRFDGMVDAVRIGSADIPEWTKKSGQWLLDNVSKFDVVHAVDLFYRSIETQFDFIDRSRLPSVVKIPTMGCIPRLVASKSTKRRLGNVDILISLSDGIRSELLEAGVGAERICSIPNGIPSAEFVPAADKSTVRKSLGLASDHAIVLYAGRLVRRKRIEILLESAKRLEGEASFVLVGSGSGMMDSNEKEMTDLARSLPNVSIAGEQEDMLPYYQASDIHILLSEREGQPNSVLEGMSCALPTVATNIHGINNLISDGIEGFLVNVGDVDGAVAALRKLIGDSGKRSAMGAAGRKRVIRQFDIGLIAGMYVKTYESIAMRRRGVRR